MLGLDIQCCLGPVVPGIINSPGNAGILHKCLLQCLWDHVVMVQHQGQIHARNKPYCFYLVEFGPYNITHPSLYRVYFPALICPVSSGHANSIHTQCLLLWQTLFFISFYFFVFLLECVVCNIVTE